MDDPYRLQRFVEAQDAAGTYRAATSELRAGQKVGHWIWYVFPQLAGLGRSETSRRYAVSCLAAARAYVEHPVLGQRLIECADLVSGIKGRSAEQILGPVDALKLHSCMTLFARAAPDVPQFRAVLDRYYQGVEDPDTVRLLASGRTDDP